MFGKHIAVVLSLLSLLAFSAAANGQPRVVPLTYTDTLVAFISPGSSWIDELGVLHIREMLQLTRMEATVPGADFTVYLVLHVNADWQLPDLIGPVWGAWEAYATPDLTGPSGGGVWGGAHGAPVNGVWTTPYTVAGVLTTPLGSGLMIGTETVTGGMDNWTGAANCLLLLPAGK